MSGQADFTQNYWSVFPEHKVIFSDIYKSDDGSNLMWCTYMYCHPDSSVAIELDPKKQIKYINSVFAGFTFDPEAQKKHIDKYISFLPHVEVQFRRMFLDLKSTIDYILDLARTKQNIDAKTTLMKKVEDRMAGLLAAEKKAKESRVEIKKGKGNYNPSLVEAEFS